jgi:hypothetical protein
MWKKKTECPHLIIYMFLTNIHREARLVGLLGFIQHCGVNSGFLKRLKHEIGVYLPGFRIRIGSGFNQVSRKIRIRTPDPDAEEQK